MKQLIRALSLSSSTTDEGTKFNNINHTNDQLHIVIVGLGDHAFLIYSNNKIAAMASDVSQQQQQQTPTSLEETSTPKHVPNSFQSIVLLPPPPPSLLSSSSMSAATSSKATKLQETDSGALTKPDPLQEILAVSIFSSTTSSASASSNENQVWCAVARGNKSLALYCIDAFHLVEQSSTTTTTTPVAPKIELAPVNVYHTSKRVGSLKFCEIMPATKSKNHGEDATNDPTTSSTTPSPLMVLLAGDLVGDVTAYKVEAMDITTTKTTATTSCLASDSNEVAMAITNKGEEQDAQCQNGNIKVDKEKCDDEDEEEDNVDDDDEHGGTQGPRRKRLLLGHTASMLTGLCLVEQPQHHHHGDMLLLTADRDEKIRVSCFPNTSLIHGFLLGHTAFVSSVAVVVVAPRAGATTTTVNVQPPPLCVSVGGDGMLRLWNVATCQEISHVAAPFRKQDENDDASSSLVVPSQVAVNNSMVVVLYDLSSRVDVFEILEQENGNISSNSNDKTNGMVERQYELQWVKTIQCPASPLSIVAATEMAGKKNSIVASFWLLCREPHYLIKLEMVHDKTPTAHWDQSMSLELRPFVHNVVVSNKELSASEEVANVGMDTNEDELIVMPTSIWERDANGLLKVAKVHDKRFAGSNDTQLPTPWNRADRIEIARQRNLRHKKRRQEKSELRYKMKKQEEQKKQKQESSSSDNN